MKACGKKSDIRKNEKTPGDQIEWKGEAKNRSTHGAKNKGKERKG